MLHAFPFFVTNCLVLPVELAIISMSILFVILIHHLLNDLSSVDLHSCITIGGAVLFKAQILDKSCKAMWSKWSSWYDCKGVADWCGKPPFWDAKSQFTRIAVSTMIQYHNRWWSMLFDFQQIGIKVSYKLKQPYIWGEPHLLMDRYTDWYFRDRISLSIFQTIVTLVFIWLTWGIYKTIGFKVQWIARTI